MGYAIGTSLESLATLESLEIPDPRGFHAEYAELVKLGSGGFRAMGFPSFTWDYGFISQAVRDLFRGYCPGVSAEVFITTRTNESSNEFLSYQAIMVWPQDEEIRAGRRLDFRLEFHHCVEVVVEEETP